MQAERSTEEAIVEAALGALAENPGASMSDVALRAGVGRATLYRYFPSRDDLLHHLAILALDETDAATGRAWASVDSAREALHAMFEALIPIGDRFHFLRSQSSQVPGRDVSRRYARQIAELGRLVERLRKEGELRAEVPSAWVVATIDSLVWVAWTEVHAGRVGREEIAGLAVDTVLRGVGR